MFMMLFFLIIILNILLYLLHSRLAKIINIYDEPDSTRKLHIGRIPVTGGFIYLINVLVIGNLIELDHNETAIIFLSLSFFSRPAVEDGSLGLSFGLSDLCSQSNPPHRGVMGEGKISAVCVRRARGTQRGTIPHPRRRRAALMHALLVQNKVGA